MTKTRPKLRDIESILRTARESFVVANSWTIGRSKHVKAWQVFYTGIDASFRLGVGTGKKKPAVKKHKTFAEALEWIKNLTNDELKAITVYSVSGITEPPQ